MGIEELPQMKGETTHFPLSQISVIFLMPCQGRSSYS
jgi:hypothetical protein